MTATQTPRAKRTRVRDEVAATDAHQDAVVEDAVPEHRETAPDGIRPDQA